MSGRGDRREKSRNRGQQRLVKVRVRLRCLTGPLRDMWPPFALIAAASALADSVLIALLVLRAPGDPAREVGGFTAVNACGHQRCPGASSAGLCRAPELRAILRGLSSISASGGRFVVVVVVVTFFVDVSQTFCWRFSGAFLVSLAPSRRQSAHPATVPGLWFRDLVNVRWDLVRSLSGACRRQFGGL